MKNAVKLFLCIALVTAQATYVTAAASPDFKSGKNLLAFAPPIAVGVPQCPEVVKQQDSLLEHGDRYIKGVTTYAHNFSDYEISWLANNGVIIGPDSSDNFIDLQSGNILLSPEEDIIVKTREGKIHIGSGATVFLSACGNNMALYDLIQRKPNQVSVTTGKDRLVMEAGQMLVLTEQNTNDFEKLEGNCHVVAYHDAQSLDLNSGAMRAFKANFSILSALTTVQPLKRLMTSKSKEDKLILEKVLQSAVSSRGCKSIRTDTKCSSNFC